MKRNPHAGQRGSGGFSLNVFTEDELREIHLATLEVLEKTGLRVEDEEALAIFDGAGAKIEKDRMLVHLPPHLVEEAIRSAPARIFLAGRDPKHDLILGGNRIGFTNFGEGVYVIDLKSGEHRSSTKQDLADAAKIIDYLDIIDVCQRAVGSRDQPEEVLTVHNAEAILTNTTKHCCLGPGDREHLKWIIEMAAAVAGGREKLKARPILTLNICPTSPLKLGKQFCHIVVDAVRQGLPINVVDMAMAGATAPISLAGAITVQNAEILGGVVLSQLVRRGAPVIYGSTTTIMDLKRGASPMGCPEIGLVSAAAAKLAQFYQIPSWVAGGWGDGKISDAQAGHEKTLNLLQAALAGANLIYGLGALETGLTLDFGQLVMDAEFAVMVKQVVKGIQVDDEMLAVDVIHEIGPFGDFISHEHTRRHMKALQSQPKLLDRRRRDFWRELGGADLARRAREEAGRILATHKPEPLPGVVAATLSDIVRAAQDELCRS
ncbi:MAG: trimethylamine methyltransferase family protein [Thermodesulfobacteriota bacterium]